MAELLSHVPKHFPHQTALCEMARYFVTFRWIRLSEQAAISTTVPAGIAGYAFGLLKYVAFVDELEHLLLKAQRFITGSVCMAIYKTIIQGFR